jgi:L-seryl-tRNA(Ser) seleniumtransferase
MRDFRVIPSIDELRRRTAVQALERRYGARATIGALRLAAAGIRAAVGAGDETVSSEAAAVSRIESDAARQLETAYRPSLEPVINATGVIVHTNLGRAPLSAVAIERVAEIASGYASLEYDVGRGARGRRDVHAEPLLSRLTGAEAAVVVNNNAAATLLVLTALAAGREVIVSRGELVEIGGGFRVPDVMAQSGAVLREVGTTNRTRAIDYASAVGERTALMLRVHPSNFTMRGFTERPALGELVDLGRRLGIPVAEDLGSGQLERGGVDTSVAESVAAGVDICCFSGDKLLGGPQAGIIVGRAALVDRIRRHPLMRALRADKMTYAALEATLGEYAAGRAETSIPVQQMLAMTADDIRVRAQRLADALATSGWRATIIAGVSAVGGGSAPGLDLPTWLVAIEKDGLPPDTIETRLRALTPPIIARIHVDRVVLDLRTVPADFDTSLIALIAGA